ncbi:phage tail protein [Lysinibacter cavernae]|uniref:Tape measure protein n=1 Tax=Lysinibacter cavernae TaxID=1640652 RepID=A0A7X5R1Q0_9MICO|nr:hypothetical protein [Lysinibacter cavernae]NIH53750.1 hypothetical protein [Lysinibacter cavernae]
MAGTGGASVERVSVQVVPDTSKLRRELQKVTKQLEKSLSIKLKVQADLRPALRSVAQLRATLGKTGATVYANLDTILARTDLEELTENREVALIAHVVGESAAIDLSSLSFPRTAEIIPSVQAAGAAATTATLALLAGGFADALAQSQAGMVLVDIMQSLGMAVVEAAASIGILTQSFSLLAEVGLAAMAVSLTLIDSIIAGPTFQTGLTMMLVTATAGAAALVGVLAAVVAYLAMLGQSIVAEMAVVTVAIGQPISAASATDAIGGIKAQAEGLSKALPGLAGSLENLGAVLEGTDKSAVPFLEKIGPVLGGILDDLSGKIPGLGGVFDGLSGVLAGVAGAADGIAFSLDLASNAMDAYATVSDLAKAAAEGFSSGSLKVAKAADGATKATNLQKIATAAGAAASKIATAVQWLWNAALTANPIGLIIVAIVALVAGIIWFFTQTELGQQIFQAVFDTIGAIITGAWENVIKPIFDAIGGIFTWLYENIIQPFVSAFWLAFGLLMGIIVLLWEGAIKPTIDAIAAAFVWIWDTIFKPIGDFLLGLINAIGVIFTWLWETAVKPVLDGIGIAFQWIWDNVFKPVGDFIMGIINGIGTVFSWLWNSAVKPAIDALGAAFQFFWNNIIKPIGDFIKGAFEAIGTTAEKVFSAVSTAVSNAFGALVGIVKGPINAVIDLINGMIGAINKIKITIPDWVPEWGGQTFGINIPKIPRLALGATVLPQPGGTLAVLAEAGRAETVVDTGKMNALMDLVIRRDSGRNPGMNEFTQENHFYERAEDPRILMRVAGAEFQTMTAGVLV